MHPKTTDNKYTELNDSKSITSIVLCHAHLLMNPQARIFHDPHSRAEHLPHSSLHYAVNLVRLEVGQRAAGRPRVGVRRAAQLEDEAQLLNLEPGGGGIGDGVGGGVGGKKGWG